MAPLQLAAARSAPATRCQSLGPFTDSTQMLSVSAALTARGIGSLVRQVERKVADGNWVYIDGLTSIAERQRVLQKLKRSGLRDVAEMTDPQYSDRISAGIFIDPSGAEERAASVRAAGFEPKVEERHRAVPERWLNVEWNVGATPDRARGTGDRRIRGRAHCLGGLPGRQRNRLIKYRSIAPA